MKAILANKNFLMFWVLLSLIILRTHGQDLSQKETIEYIENKLLENRIEENKIPTGMGKNKVKYYKLELNYDNLILKTYLKDGSHHVKMAKLKDSDIWVKLSPERHWESANVYKPEHQCVYIGSVNLPPFAFLREEDAKKIVKALNYLKKFCKSDPFE